MTIEELEEVFRKAVSREGYWSTPDEPYTSVRRAGIRSIVRALAPDDDEVAAYTRLTLRVRKEMPCECEYLPEDRCISCEVAAALTCLEKRYHEIIGDAGEKVAGGLPDDAVPIPLMHPESAISAPATDAAPAVCEWIPWQGHWFAHGEALSSRAGQTHCPSCGKPIAFTEAK